MHKNICRNLEEELTVPVVCHGMKILYRFERKNLVNNAFISIKK